jgi:uncharacterized membrane protein
MSVNNLIFILTLIAALGSGLIAGLFFAFSTSVMKALGRLPAAEGMAAMQSINTMILNPIFLGTFMGTAVVCLLLAVVSLVRWQEPGATWLVAGAAFYLIGSIAVTMVFNVPMNNALAASTAADPASADLWAKYLTDWTFWNHVRTIASLAASASFIFGLVYRAS